MSAAYILSFLSGACFAAALSGACRALTAIPSWAMVATAIVLLTLAVFEGLRCENSSPCRTGGAWFVAGALSALALPAATPLPLGSPFQYIARVAGEGGNLFAALERVDENPRAVVGRRIIVEGEWMPATMQHDAAVFRRIMACCAADAIAVGFDVRMSHRRVIRAGDWVRVAGTVGERLLEGEPRFILDDSVVTERSPPH